jgi:hypothetical protein
MDIIRALRGRDPGRDWNGGIKDTATRALDDVGFDWKTEVNRPPSS